MDVSVNFKTPFVDAKDHWNTLKKKLITMVKDRYKKKKKKLVDQRKKHISQKVLMTKLCVRVMIPTKIIQTVTHL